MVIPLGEQFPRDFRDEVRQPPHFPAVADQCLTVGLANANGDDCIARNHGGGQFSDGLPPDDLTAEFAWMAGETRLAHLDRLFRLGVPPAALRPQRCAVVRIETDAAGFFQPVETGALAVVVMDGVLCLPYARVDELVAFNTADPATWWLRRGDTPVLGLAGLECARGAGEPIDLHATPWDWLRHGCDGVVVVRWDEVDPRRTFAGVPVVRCASDLIRNRIRQRLRQLNRVDFDLVVADQVEAAA